MPPKKTRNVTKDAVPKCILSPEPGINIFAFECFNLAAIQYTKPLSGGEGHNRVPLVAKCGIGWELPAAGGEMGTGAIERQRPPAHSVNAPVDFFVTHLGRFEPLTV